MEEMGIQRDSHEEGEIADPIVLHELLARLNDPDDERILSRPEVITVEDVAEALHLDPDYVAAELRAIYEEHRLARLSGVIRELEEPLYRVERPGHNVLDSSNNPLYKLRSVQILADRNKETELPRRPKHSEQDRVAQFVSYLILGGMAIVMIFVIGKVLFAGR